MLGAGTRALTMATQKPNQTEDGIMKKVEKYGFTHMETGGGCTAWRRDNGDRTYYMITDEHGGGIPKGGEPVLLGQYDDHGEPLGYWDYKNLDECLSKIRRMK